MQGRRRAQRPSSYISISQFVACYPCTRIYHYHLHLNVLPDPAPPPAHTQDVINFHFIFIILIILPPQPATKQLNDDAIQLLLVACQLEHQQRGDELPFPLRTFDAALSIPYICFKRTHFIHKYDRTGHW